MVSDTSVSAFRDLNENDSLVSDRQRVLDVLRKFGACTDSEIAEFLGEKNPVDSKKFRPRRKELVDEGLVVSVGKSVCEVSGRVVLLWDLARGVSKVGDKPECLSDVQFRGLLRKLRNANVFQKRKVKELVDRELGL